MSRIDDVMGGVFFDAQASGASLVMFSATRVTHVCRLDESGTDGQGPLVSMGGLVSTPKRWELLTRKWLRTLADPRFRSSITGGPLPEAKYSDCRARKRHYEGWSDPQIETFLGDLADHIRKHTLFAVGASVYLPDYQRIIADRSRKPGAMADPYRWVMQSCLESVVKAKELKSPDKVLCEFDAGHPKPGVTEQYFLTLTRDDQEAVIARRDRIIPKYGAASSIDVPALQAADILVGAVRWGTRTYLDGSERAETDIESVARIKVELVLKGHPIYGMFFTREKLGRMWEEIEAHRRGEITSAPASSSASEVEE